MLVFVNRHCGEQGRAAVAEWFEDNLPEFRQLWDVVKMKLIRGGRYGE